MTHGDSALPDRAIRETLELVPLGKHDQRLIEALLKAQGDPDLNSLIRRRSTQLTTKMLLVATTLRAADQVPTWLQRHRIIWIPRQRLALLALRESNEYFVVISNGFLDMVNLMAQYMIMRIVLSRKLELDSPRHAALGAHSREIDQMFLRILHSHIEGSEPVFLPELLRETPRSLQVPALTIVSTVRLFAILHEIGHIELGHLDRYRRWFPWRRRSFRTEDLPIREYSNRSKRFEHEADVFAVAHGPKTNSLLAAASIFFSLLGLVHSMRGHVGQSHPHAANRLAHLLREFPEPKDQGLSGFATIKRLSELMSSPYDFGADISLKTQKEKYPAAPVEALEIFWFLDSAASLFKAVEERPSDFPDLTSH
jgi:hypothetical protein